MTRLGVLLFCFIAFLRTAVHCFQFKIRGAILSANTKRSGGVLPPRHDQRRSPPPLFMALTPVGPFCPFRSSAAQSFDDRMERMSANTPTFAAEMSRLQLDLQFGRMPDPERLQSAANNLEYEVDEWERLLMRLRLASDFQTREYAKLTQAHLASYNTSVETIALSMKWQASCMRAMAENQMPPPPPPGLDVFELMEKQQQKQQQQQPEDGTAGMPPSVTSMAMAESITAAPFAQDSSAFESPTVQNEYERLCQDHMNLIEFGGKYGNFDPLGKLYYLDEIDKIQDRWDIFYARFQLMGLLNPKFVQQCNAFLSSMNLTEDRYRQLLDQCHILMREEAEAERNLAATASNVR